MSFYLNQTRIHLPLIPNFSIENGEVWVGIGSDAGYYKLDCGPEFGPHVITRNRATPTNRQLPWCYSLRIDGRLYIPEPIDFGGFIYWKRGTQSYFFYSVEKLAWVLSDDLSVSPFGEHYSLSSGFPTDGNTGYLTSPEEEGGEPIPIEIVFPRWTRSSDDGALGEYSPAGGATGSRFFGCRGDDGVYSLNAKSNDCLIGEISIWR